MIYARVTAIYKNKYAYIYIADKISVYGNVYQMVFIGRVQDGTIYDVIILPPTKYKQTKQAFTIYHTDGEPEVFYIVNTNTP